MVYGATDSVPGWALAALGEHEQISASTASERRTTSSDASVRLPTTLTNNLSVSRNIWDKHTTLLLLWSLYIFYEQRWESLIIQCGICGLGSPAAKVQEPRCGSCRITIYRKKKSRILTYSFYCNLANLELLISILFTESECFLVG